MLLSSTTTISAVNAVERGDRVGSVSVALARDLRSVAVRFFVDNWAPTSPILCARGSASEVHAAVVHETPRGHLTLTVRG